MSRTSDRLRRQALGLVLFAAVGGLVAGAGWAASASMRSGPVAPVAAAPTSVAPRGVVGVLAGSVPNRTPVTTLAPGQDRADVLGETVQRLPEMTFATATTAAAPATTVATTVPATVSTTTEPATTLPAAVAKGTTVATAKPATAVATVPSPERRVTGIGDSIMFGATPALKGKVTGELTVDAVVGRNYADGIDVVKELAKQKAFGDVVVVHLGTNNGATTTQVKNMLDRLKSVRTVLVVNVRVPRDYQDSTNAALASVSRAYRNVRLVDWYSASQDHPELFAGDGYHLTPDGSAFYATLIADATDY